MTSSEILFDSPADPVVEGPVLQVEDLHVSFPSESGRVRAVRGLSYQVSPGEVLGIVGESGSGKSVSSLAVMGLLPSSARITGSIKFQGRELIGRSDADLSKIRGRRISMVFQDPLSALTPVYTVGDQIAEAILVHRKGGVTKQSAAKRAVELLDLVGIPNAVERAKAFPHEFSGGMRQRAVIAMAIANDPDLIIADEPTTALDVTVQAQVLQLLETAQEVTGAGIVIITHDLGVVAGFADRLMVMYAGRAVETGKVDEIYERPRMPYTLGLLGSIPRLDVGEKQPLVPITGQPPSLTDLPRGARSRRVARWSSTRATPRNRRSSTWTARPSTTPRASGPARSPRPPARAPRRQPRSSAPRSSKSRRSPRCRASSARPCWSSTTWSRSTRSTRAWCSSAASAPCTPWPASPSTSAKARPSAWSASRAAARPRPSWRSSAWKGR
ncbi:ABC transporter ATP-binding protein [Lentzea indica]|uniref:ABC transporter ATP-binding protein n=1 Tax=Lentzea indica TaxID=2604800 RepID=UPI0035E40798